MTTLFRKDDLNPQDAAEFLYTLSAAYLDYTDAAGDEEMRCFNDEQHTLTAYCYLDSQVQEGGFVQLIAAGYGEYVFHNPVADSLRRWRIKPTPKILDKAKALYERDGAKIEEMADSGAVTIANHTLSHPKLHNLPTRAEKENEIIGANKALKYHLGIDNLWFAYPYGDYDDEVIDICKKAGIKLAVTTDAGRVHVGSYPYDLKRVYIGNNVSLARFMERLTKDNYAPL